MQVHGGFLGAHGEVSRLDREKAMYDTTKIDYPMLISCLGLVIIGLISVYSASSIISARSYGDSFFFVRHQLLSAIIGTGVLFLTSRIPYHFYRKITYPLLIISLLGLFLVLTPGIGTRVNGASRWVRLGPFSLQVSEYAKLALIIYLAYSLEKKNSCMKSFSIGFLPHLLVGGILALLVLIEPDLGSAIIYMTLVFVMLFIAGTRFRYIAGTLVAGLPLLYLLIWTVPYRLERILAFLNPWADPFDRGYHLVHSLLALTNGGFWGVGLGRGCQKLFYLPEPHTDFIMAVITEELGLFGLLLIVMLFVFLLWRGVLIARRAPDLFGSYLAFGIITMICLEAVVNMGVVVGFLPTKGLPLPFVACMASVVIVVNVHRSTPERKRKV